MNYFADSTACREAGITYHLVPTDAWKTAKDDEWYKPAPFESDGFIHCTNGIDQLITVGNWFYTADDRDFCVLVLDVAKLRSDVRYDDAEQLFPHIYGLLNTDAVLVVFTVSRAEDGTFLSVEQH